MLFENNLISLKTSLDKRSLSTGKQTKFAKPVNNRSLSTDVAKLRSACFLSFAQKTEKQTEKKLKFGKLFLLT
jgi:hypothetical protein